MRSSSNVDDIDGPNAIQRSRVAWRRTQAAPIRASVRTMGERQESMISGDNRRQNARAMDALEEAREMPPGAPRTEALKKAGLLRRTADSQGLIFAKRGRPRK